MPRETRKPSEPTDLSVKSSRRKFLTGIAIVLGASALTQPNGGVISTANATPKKDGAPVKTHAKKSHKKKGGKKDE